MRRFLSLLVVFLCAVVLVPSIASAADLSIHAARATAQPLSGMTFRAWRVGELGEDGRTLVLDDVLLPDFEGAVDLGDAEASAKGAEDLLEALEGVPPMVLSEVTDESGDVVLRDLADGVWLLSAEQLTLEREGATEMWTTVPVLVVVPDVDAIAAKTLLATEPVEPAPEPEPEPSPEDGPQVVPVISKLPQTGVVGIVLMALAAAGFAGGMLVRRARSGRGTGGA